VCIVWNISIIICTEVSARYGAETPVLDWRERLVCSRCGSRQVDMVVRGNHSEIG
jgi:hypothetical protein